MARTELQVDLNANWDMLQRGIYRREIQLGLYYEVERLYKLLREAEKKLEALEPEKAEGATG